MSTCPHAHACACTHKPNKNELKQNIKATVCLSKPTKFNPGSSGKVSGCPLVLATCEQSSFWFYTKLGGVRQETWSQAHVCHTLS